MKRIFYIAWMMFCLQSLYAQERLWSLDDCIQYAVSHNHDVQLQQLQIDDYQNEKRKAVGAFLPAVEANVGGQFNFGRAIDPETNTYTHVNTFYNNYGVSASIPLFDGFQRYNELRAAKANLLMGREGLVAEKDKIAQQVLKAYMDALYYQSALRMAEEKREESDMLLHQTRVMVEVGSKGEADVAQMEATYAADDYEVTRQQGLLNQALLSLKQQMNYPGEELLNIDTLILHSLPMENDAKLMKPEEFALSYCSTSSPSLSPTIRQAEHQLQSATYAYRSSRAGLLPSITVGAGYSTTYYKQFGSAAVQSFSEQFRNNAGEFVYATLSIPLFNRLSTISSIRRHRNQVLRAKENLHHEQQEWQRLIQETHISQQNSWMEMQKMEKKVEADRLAARLTIRKYEEGLSSSIDVQTATVTLLQSKAQLLQCKLHYMYQTKILHYYQGIPLWIAS